MVQIILEPRGGEIVFFKFIYVQLLILHPVVVFL